MKHAENALNRHFKIDKLSQSQYNASVDFLFNLGTGYATNSISNFYKALNNDNIYKRPISQSAKSVIVE